MPAAPGNEEQKRHPEAEHARELDAENRRRYEEILTGLNERFAICRRLEQDTELDSALARINAAHDPFRPRPGPGGWRGRLRRLLARLAGPLVRPVVQDALLNQAEFNAAMVRWLNGLNQAVREALYLQRDYNAELARFGQAIVPVIDGKVREAYYALDDIIARNVKHLIDRADTLFNILDQRQINFENGMTGLTQGHQETLEWLHNTRRELGELLERIEAIREETRQGLQLQHRKIEELLASFAASARASGQPPGEAALGETPAPGEQAAAGDGQPPRRDSATPATPSPTPEGDLGAYDYFLFELAHRGDPADLRRRLADYLPYFRDSGPVLDLGCGRGEFLELLREAGISARGVDQNLDMVHAARERGLDVEHADLFAALQATEHQSLGGVFLAQVIEHLPPGALGRLWRESHRVLRPGGILLAETVNPLSVYAFLHNYLRDPTHLRPIHPDTAAFMLRGAGFQQVEILWRSPVDPETRLPAPQADPEDPELRAVVLELGRIVERLNALLFSWQDYAVVGRR
jgi:O-antigen chain-terminating methyltransferase